MLLTVVLLAHRVDKRGDYGQDPKQCYPTNWADPDLSVKHYCFKADWQSACAPLTPAAVEAFRAGLQRCFETALTYFDEVRGGQPSRGHTVEGTGGRGWGAVCVVLQCWDGPGVCLERGQKQGGRAASKRPKAPWSVSSRHHQQQPSSRISRP